MKIDISCFPNILEFFSTFERTSFWVFAQHCGSIRSGDMTIYILIFLPIFLDMIFWPVNFELAHLRNESCYRVQPKHRYSLFQVVREYAFVGVKVLYWEGIKSMAKKTRFIFVTVSFSFWFFRAVSQICFRLRGNKVDGKKDKIYFRYC